MVQTTLWFGLAATIFFVAIVVFLAFSLTRGSLRSPYYLLPPIHAGIAGTAYVLMTLASAGVLPGALDIELFRYADWTLSTPIITYYLAMLAGASTVTRVIAVGANVLMILFGYVSVLTTGPVKWGAFAVSSLLFLVLIYLFLRTFSRAIADNPEASQGLFKSLRDLTVAIWTLYPVAYVLGPNGLALLQVADHHFVIVVLDLTAKVGFMTLMLVRQYQLNMFVARETTAAPE